MAAGVVITRRLLRGRPPIGCRTIDLKQKN